MDSNLFLAILSAIKAGDEILKVYNEDNTEVELKADSSPLTQADRVSHHAIVEGLKQTGLPILSEEGKEIPYEQRASWELFWLVDPLDGTKEFIKRNGEFTVNIALVAYDTPIMGVVYVPVSRTIYFGGEDTRSRKAYVPEGFGDGDMDALLENAEFLTDNEYPEIYTIVASRSHSGKETEEFVSRKQEELGSVDLISSGSSIKFCLVAERKAHIYPRLAPTMEWDTAAAHAIARYSDCNVYDYVTGAELKYNKENMLNPWFVVAAKY